MNAIRLTALFVLFIGATALYAASPTWAQQKYTFENYGGAKGELVQQHYIEVGDVPRHFVGVDEDSPRAKRSERPVHRRRLGQSDLCARSGRLHQW